MQSIIYRMYGTTPEKEARKQLKAIKNSGVVTRFLLEKQISLKRMGAGVLLKDQMSVGQWYLSKLLFAFSFGLCSFFMLQGLGIHSFKKGILLFSFVLGWFFLDVLLKAKNKASNDEMMPDIMEMSRKERIRNEAHLSQQETCSDYQSKEYIQRRSLIQLIYKGLSDVKTITKTQYEQVLKTYPVITELYAAIKEFYEILYSRRDERLETWLEKIENFNIPELQTYVNGIRIDINAVKNGIKLKYNNGLAEGSVNKIKVIKRIMYGRNSFDLLKAKVLLHEHFRCEFN